MAQDAYNMVKGCKKCQQFANVLRSPLEDLTSIFTPWLLAQWRVDIVGPLPLEKGGVKFVIVVIDSFTKWAEAKALATIIEKNIEHFMLRLMVCRFGIPHLIVLDNGKQFDNHVFRD